MYPWEPPQPVPVDDPSADGNAASAPASGAATGGGSEGTPAPSTPGALVHEGGVNEGPTVVTSTIDALVHEGGEGEEATGPAGSPMDNMQTLVVDTNDSWPPCPWIPKTDLRRWQQPRIGEAAEGPADHAVAPPSTTGTPVDAVVVGRDSWPPRPWIPKTDLRRWQWPKSSATSQDCVLWIFFEVYVRLLFERGPYKKYTAGPSGQC